MSTKVEERPEPLVRVRFLAEGQHVGNRIHARGDVATIPESRALRMFEYGICEYADPGKRTPTPAEATYNRQLAAGMVSANDPRRMASDVAEFMRASTR